MVIDMKFIPFNDFYKGQSKVDSPCRNCKKRQIGCHVECVDYKRYKTELKTQKVDKNSGKGENYYGT